jgi:rRNA processing protein Gar1
MEHECEYVSSRGILKSCNVRNTVFASSDTHLEVEQFLSTKNNDLVYVNNSALVGFFKDVFPLIQSSFILVTGDSDVTVCASDFEQYIDDPKLVHWHSQNLIYSHSQNLITVHSKVSHLPIGLDYHTNTNEREMHPWGIGSKPVVQESLLKSIIQKPLAERYFGCYINFHFSEWGINQRGDRQECLSQVPKELCYFEPHYIQRKATWDSMSRFVFVLCPHGGGLDTHRLWEALILGCIPIIKSSGLDPLFEDLNVCIVKSWSDVNVTRLVEHIQTMKPTNKKKLTLNYWIDKIRLSSI